MTDLEHIRIDRPQDGVVVATLDRPSRMNALTFDMFQELRQLAELIHHDSTARVMVMTGAGRAFCAGLDLTDAGSLVEMDPAEMLHRQETWGEAVMAISKMAQPVIAAVNGAAAGAGLSIAMAADIRLASEAARFNAAFVRIGLSGGDCGSSWTLPRLVGLGHAAEILLTGRFVDADEAARIGLVNRVVQSDALMSEALALASQIASNSPFGVRLTKSVLRQNVDATSIDAALEVENRNQVLATRSADMPEALAAFLEKRAPVFTPRTARSSSGAAGA